MSRFPLALPPHTPSPLLYAHGLSFILPIYATLESSLLHATSSSIPDPRTASILRQLRIPELERTLRIQNDLALLGTPTQVRDNAEDNHPPSLRSFLQHITAVSTSKPHLLLAYTWILYLALFSGGRYLRAQLRSANAETWHLSPDDRDAPLQFWCFAGDRDGEDIKADFKAKFRGSETLLTSEERREVVDEGVVVMNRMLEVVREIEATVGPLRKEADETQHEETISLKTRMLLVRVLLPINVLKILGSWSWKVASGVGAGFGFREAGAVPVA